MKVLVTGATGFIGNYVVQYLIDNGHNVIASALSADEVKSCEWLSKVNFIECDLNETKPNFWDFFDKPEILIHLAWQGLPNYNELFHFERNLFSNYSFIKNFYALRLSLSARSSLWLKMPSMGVVIRFVW